jgi:mannose-6-phosphate isomerase-like protein (cupin superfamily)
MVEEARLEQLAAGLTPVTEGWFVVNVRDGAWVTNEALGAACIFEGDDAPFPDVGFTLSVLQPGQAGGRYHRESNQENFLVLAGECLLLIEGEERRLEAWDFVHCPPDTEHAFVGAGDIVYPRSELALRHDAGVETETTSPREAYAPFPKWQLGPPDDWNGLPWARRDAGAKP